MANLEFNVSFLLSTVGTSVRGHVNVTTASYGLRIARPGTLWGMLTIDRRESSRIKQPTACVRLARRCGPHA